MKSNDKTRKLVYISILSALVVVFQIISNFITIGPVSINLALIPIIIGAIMIGPWAGFILGVVNGIVVTLTPLTIATFMPYGVFLTIVICLLKTGIAGLVSGLLYKALKKWNKLALVIASITVPLINTLIFSSSVLLFYQNLLAAICPDGTSYFVYVVIYFIGINFIVEFVLVSVLSPTTAYIINIYKSKH